ncbi:hypothetical protein NDU88_001499 [Pleurodeles waltl]|uniref:C-type lectin domain-containing protein n=2 Tax=Pleurodeles waltl TaxID=8319 RepID=A0AAV7USZ5_PLEWA|nr:hypothetical protein NDU88_001499 [Pleurodeles waltl]
MCSYSAGQANFPNGWEIRSATYYKYFSYQKTWVEAELYCQSLTPGAHLASVHSLEENSYIQQLVLKSAKANAPIWIGASDCYKDRSFMWTDGSQWNFQAWHRGEPNNFEGREPCLQFNFNSPGIWNDMPCSATMSFVCKVLSNP